MLHYRGIIYKCFPFFNLKNSVHTSSFQKVNHFSKCYYCTNRTISQSTYNAEEMKNFNQLASEWWKYNSSFRLLMSMNELRVPFIRDGILSALNKGKSMTLKPLENFRILDVGCGGGFLSEPLARLGANVLGIDASSDTIKVATEHATLDVNLKDRLIYKCSTVEDLVDNVDSFDAVVCSEVIEHVDNPEFFIKNCTKLTKENGSLFFTTINKTLLSYFGGIIFAEYIANYVPRGTHDWDKFISPIDLQKKLESEGCEVQIIHGLVYNSISNSWCWVPWTNLSYAMHAIKLKCNE